MADNLSLQEIVRAGAGAGKTKTLTEKVVGFTEDFFRDNKRAPRILITTFTKKATQELRERILKKATESSSPAVINYVSKSSQLHVSTIHGVLSLFLHRYATLLGFDANFKIVDSLQENKLAKKILRETLLKIDGGHELLNHFDINQLTAMVTEFNENRFGPKPYKEVEFNELVALSERVLGESFSKFQDLTIELASGATDPKWIEYAQAIKKINKIMSAGVLDHISDWLSAVDEVERPRISKKLPEDFVELAKAHKASLEKVTEFNTDILKKETLREYEFMGRTFHALADLCFEQLDKAKKERGMVSMSDLEGLALRAIRENPAVVDAFASDFDYWLIDEFQDTSPLQVEIFRNFAKSAKAFYVGDPQQSIYLFRGARYEVFENKVSDIQKNGGTLNLLDVNYRSRDRLLLFFNDFFTKLGKQFHPMIPRDFEVDKVKAKHEPVAYFLRAGEECTDKYAGITAILSEKIKLGARLEDFCVLTRTNQELRNLSKYLEGLGWAVHVHATDGFYQRREVVDVLTILKFLVNPHDNLNFVRLVRGPWFKISDDKLAVCFMSRPISYWQQVQKELINNETVKNLLAALSEVDERGVFETFKSLLLKTDIITYSHLHDNTGRRESNIWKVLVKIQDEERRPGFNYATFLQQVLNTSGVQAGEGESDAMAVKEPNRINMMTVHKSKGLSFKYVIVPDLHKRTRTSDSKGHGMPLLLDEENFKFTVSLKLGEENKSLHNLFGRKILEDLAGREEGEYLRLVYVALTRAEEAVVLHWQDPAPEEFILKNNQWELGEGTHETDNYFYEVRRFEGEPIKGGIAHTNNLVVREKFQWKASLGGGFKKTSVTQFLSENLQPDSKDVRHIGAQAVASPERQKRELIAPILGQHFHRMIEKVKYQVNQKGFELNQFLEETKQQLSERYHDDEEASRLYRALNFTLGLNEPPILNLIKGGEVEWGFQLNTKAGVLEGQIDLWGIEQISGGPQVWIIDYKTGSSKTSDLAFAQLELYSLAIREFYKVENIKLAVIYAVEQKVEIKTAESTSRWCL